MVLSANLLQSSSTGHLSRVLTLKFEWIAETLCMLEPVEHTSQRFMLHVHVSMTMMLITTCTWRD